MKTYEKQILIGVILIGIVIGISQALWETQRQKEAASARNLTSTAEVVVETHASYIRLSREEMLKQADAIVVGQVTKVSATRFNQDSGEIWEATVDKVIPIALHYVDVQIDEALVDVVGLDGNVTIAVLGTSPMDSSSQAEQADHQLKPGDRVIVFLSFAELAWREGTRPVWRFVGAPAESAFVLQDDGLYHDGWLDKSPISLDELVAQVKQ